EAEKAVTALKDLIQLRRYIEPGVLMAELDKELDDFPQPPREEKLALCMAYFDRLDAALREPALKQDGPAPLGPIRAHTDPAALQADAKKLLKERNVDEKKQQDRIRKKTRVNLQEIGLALHMYHDTFKQLPPWAICDKQGRPLLSWRVALLPYVEQGALYNEFHLDEPWESPHNIKLLDKMPSVFAIPGGPNLGPGSTHYQGFVGKGAGWELLPSDNARLGAYGLKLTSIQDGTSNTWAVVEAAEPVPWTKPA